MQALKQQMIDQGIRQINSWMSIAECDAAEAYRFYLGQTCAGPAVLLAIREHFGI
jgi:hypothetical protein